MVQPGPDSGHWASFNWSRGWRQRHGGKLMQFLNHVSRNGMRLSVSFVQKLSDRHVRRYGKKQSGWDGTERPPSGKGRIPSLPFPTLNGRSVRGIYPKSLVRGAISRTELLNISFATTCFEPFLGLLCLLVLIELENFLVRPFLSSFRKVRLCSGSNLRSGRAPPSITLGGGIIPFSSPTWVSECLWWKD